MAGVFMSDRARLADLRDEREALRIRLVWANRAVSMGANARVKHLRDVYAMGFSRVSREIQEIEGRVKLP